MFNQHLSYQSLSSSSSPLSSHSSLSSEVFTKQNILSTPPFFSASSLSKSTGRNEKPPNHMSQTQASHVYKSTVAKRIESLRKNSFCGEFSIGQGRDQYQRKGDVMVNEASVDSVGSDNEETEVSIHHSIKKSDSTTSANAGKSLFKSDNEETYTDDKWKTFQFSCQEGNVGFSSLPSQVHRKSIRKGFEFVLLVVGETGLGKSTLINTLFRTDIYDNAKVSKIERTLEVGTRQVVLEEGGVKLSLTVVDTPGYGDAVDNTDCWEPVVEYVEKQFDKILEAETRVKRESLPDSRVHACLYFIAPTGHGLKRMDVEFMKRLHNKVNLIPVIGKADACTREELERFKQNIREQLVEQGITVFQFPEEEDQHETLASETMPFAVVGSNVVIEDQYGKQFLGRKYPWGFVNIEDKTHSDFSLLRDLLLRQHTQHLIDVTTTTHYENYRCAKLTRITAGGQDSWNNKNPLAAIEDEEKEQQDKLGKIKSDMEEVLIQKVKEKNENLDNMKIYEEESLEQERQILDLQKAEIDSRRAEFEKEKVEWETKSNHQLSSKSTESLGRKKKYRFSLGTLRLGRQHY